MKVKKRSMRKTQVSLAVAILVAGSLAILNNGWAHGAPPTPPPPVQVTLKVTATSGGGTLAYRWRATDGTINNVNAATTTWTLPDGPGLHFAYVLVSNGKGGYTERRVAVNTDTIGNPATTPPPATLLAPASSVPAGEFYRSYITWGDVSSIKHGVKMPNIPVYVSDTISGKHYPPTGTVTTNLKGEFTIPHVPAIGSFQTECSVDGGATFDNCTTNGPVTLSIPAGVATTDYVFGTPLSFPPVISGSLVLQDGSPCGTSNEFFGVHSTATATLLDSFDVKLAGPVQLNDVGDYSLPYNASAATVQLKCEGAAAVNVAVVGLNASGVTDLGRVKLAGVSAPTVSNMTATIGATTVGSLLAPPAGLPSDIVPSSTAFLAEKGLDTRRGACQYYKSVGAVTSCDASGNMTGAISFEDWKRTVKIDKYAVSATTYTATYVNRVDLNLTRNHHSVSYGPNDTAAYVCNSLGPPFTSPTQAQIDAAIDSAVAGKDLVACVAMDYTITPKVNGGKPFIRFLIFGPNGELLPSINLDGRREKFVPGTCVVCHGGDQYAGKYPEGATAASVGGRFVPYDTGNFLFSSKVGLREVDQEESIYHLNQNVLNAGPTGAEQDLISGWYASSHTLNKNYVPPSWAPQSAIAISFYKNVVARSCRTCHVALVEGYNFDHYANITPSGPFYRGEDASLDVGITVCGGDQVIRAHTMPNSLITFNRFWLTSGTAVDQPKILSTFLGPNVSPTGTCTKGLTP